MVAKESRHIGRDVYKIGFHESFAKTQLKARRIADSFNKRVRERLFITAPLDQPPEVWEISFLPFAVYTFMEAGSVPRSVLAEKKLVGRYTKWNGNNGYVCGDVDSLAERRTEDNWIEDGAEDSMGAILECDEDESDSEKRVNSVGSSSGGDEAGRNTPANEPETEANPESFARGARGGDEGDNRHPFAPTAQCYVQAFSHFSYRSTRGKMLVCDLQGVMSRTPLEKDCAGVFELTDPSIHYRSNSGRKQVYGRTDLGMRGIRAFFETHKCNHVCRLLGLGR